MQSEHHRHSSVFRGIVRHAICKAASWFGMGPRSQPASPLGPADGAAAVVEPGPIRSQHRNQARPGTRALNVFACAVALASIAAPAVGQTTAVDINGGSSWNGWTLRGSFLSPGIWGGGSTTRNASLYTTVFTFNNDAATGGTQVRSSGAPVGFAAGTHSPGAFANGNTILGIGVDHQGTARAVGSTFVAFGLGGDNFRAASAIGAGDGRTSISQWGRPGDFSVWLNHGEAGPSQLAVMTADGTSQGGSGSNTSLVGGVGSGVSYDFAFRMWRNGDVGGSFQIFFDLTAMQNLYRSTGASYRTYGWSNGLGSIAAIGSAFTVSMTNADSGWTASSSVVFSLPAPFIGTVPIGDAGNAAGSTTYGSVPYTYNIGQTEVTNAQYAAFLNAKAASDPFALYSTNMAGSTGGITRSGSAGSYTYSTISGRANNPVNWVSFWDACRFANWLHNGQGNGDTETGAYTLTSAGINANTITRNAGAQWAVTSEHEWYKAAYYQPASAGGDSENYWLYPTSSNTITTAEANFGNVIGNTTPVGSYAANYSGVYDMAGNLGEWTEGIWNTTRRNMRGEDYTSPSIVTVGRVIVVHTAENSTYGFRVVQVVQSAKPKITSWQATRPTP